jgi:DNA invertase Pin-like site-specific DNA recombinase
MRVVLYARVSSDEQATDGVSLLNQQAKLRAFADLHDLELVEMIVDAGVSAKNLNRPGLQQALSLLRKGQADGLVVYKLDRLSRSVADWNHLIDGYFGDRAGKQLMSVSDSIDTRTAAGRLVLNVLMSVAQWERETIAERTRDAMNYKRARGERLGQIPFGNDLGEDGKTLTRNPTESEAIAHARELRAGGMTLQAITDELNHLGMSTKRGGPWHLTSVVRLLKRAS